ncbi:MAG: HAD family acid phosphatase [Terracidiphilus sp.]|nr:HAD family acid phosphatase [Terracidiphilus sp.]
MALCGTAPVSAQRTAPLTAGERIQNLDQFKGKLKRYHDCTVASVCYAHDLGVEADRAIAFLDRRAARNARGEKLAVVLDIDETTLSNYEEMLKAGFAYDSKAFDAWVESAAAPAIPGTLRLVKDARRLGVSVFFLTGRAESERAATDRNLRAQGFDDYARLILRGAGEEKMTAAEYKSRERAKIAAEGYRIVLSVGDQWSDLRGKPEAEYSVKYPNPYYFIP